MSQQKPLNVEAKVVRESSSILGIVTSRYARKLEARMFHEN